MPPACEIAMQEEEELGAIKCIMGNVKVEDATCGNPLNKSSEGIRAVLLKSDKSRDLYLQKLSIFLMRYTSPVLPISCPQGLCCTSKNTFYVFMTHTRSAL